MNVYIINSMRKHIGVIEAVFVVFEVKWHHGYSPWRQPANMQ